MADFKRMDWTEDEVILALDLYFREGPLDDTDPQVIELSNLMRQLPLHPPEVRAQAKFRNPNGVSLKLKNFLPLDETYDGVGMTSYSKTDERVFHRYVDRRGELSTIAEAIRHGSATFPVEAVDEEDDDAVASEGRLLMRKHVRRERNRSLRSKKIKQALTKTNGLICEVCGMTFAEVYGPVGEGYIECHHVIPLSATGPTTTRLDDLALVCPNCHRMLHRDKDLSVTQLREEVEARRTQAVAGHEDDPE